MQMFHTFVEYELQSANNAAMVYALVVCVTAMNPISHWSKIVSFAYILHIAYITFVLYDNHFYEVLGKN